LIPEKWREFLRPLTNKPSFKKLSDIVFEEYGKYGEYMFPPQNKIFNALEQIGSPEDVRVVINGQDPYIRPNQAIGMAFAVNRDFQPLPPSLVNIYKEMQSDLNIEPASHGDLTCWA
jgi:uracil-DNA glycosylase